MPAALVLDRRVMLRTKLLFKYCLAGLIFTYVALRGFLLGYVPIQPDRHSGLNPPEIRFRTNTAQISRGDLLNTFPLVTLAKKNNIGLNKEGSDLID